ncbi:MAG: hypothetical protein HY809_06865 [Nitrospirae bacterium]|nr:hypothetical protein [Nitrospirota bacterium]
MPRFDEIWNRMINHAGDNFYTKTRFVFTYEINGDIFSPSRTHYKISKVDFEKAYARVPIDGPGVINNIVRGPAYVWAVLHDQRISKGMW